MSKVKYFSAKMVRKHPLIREILRGDDNVTKVVVAVGKFDPKTNKKPFNGCLLVLFSHHLTSLVSGVYNSTIPGADPAFK